MEQVSDIIFNRTEVTDHGSKRLKERLNIKKRAQNRFVATILSKGEISKKEHNGVWVKYKEDEFLFAWNFVYFRFYLITCKRPNGSEVTEYQNNNRNHKHKRKKHRSKTYKRLR